MTLIITMKDFKQHIIENVQRFQLNKEEDKIHIYYSKPSDLMSIFNIRYAIKIDILSK